MPQREFGVFLGFSVRGYLIKILVHRHSKLHELFWQCAFEMVFSFMSHAHAEWAGELGNRRHIIFGECCKDALCTRQQCPHFFENMTTLGFS